MKIGLEVLKKGNNFLGKEKVGSSNLLVGSNKISTSKDFQSSTQII